MKVANSYVPRTGSFTAFQTIDRCALGLVSDLTDYRLQLVTDTEPTPLEAMTIFSYATAKAEKMEEAEFTLTLKPLVLSIITMPLKVA